METQSQVRLSELGQDSIESIFRLRYLLLSQGAGTV